ncbi:MAG: PilN domain-containing protein [Burkholderiales bacterium]|nr:PilN domain-containing protein [Burkholderiales bacterium]
MSQQINLFNPELSPQQSHLNARNMLWCAVFLLVLAGGLHFYLNYFSVQSQRLLDNSTAQLKLMTSEITALRNSEVPKIKNTVLETELNDLMAALVRRQQIAGILNATDFGNTAGYSAYFTAFAKQIPANVWITGMRIEGAGHDLQVQGRTLQAELVPTFVAQLKNEKIMQGKTFAALQMERPPLDEKAEASGGKKIRKDELAPYLEFELHSVEAKAPASVAGGKTP